MGVCMCVGADLADHPCTLQQHSSHPCFQLAWKSSAVLRGHKSRAETKLLRSVFCAIFTFHLDVLWTGKTWRNIFTCIFIFFHQPCYYVLLLDAFITATRWSSQSNALANPKKHQIYIHIERISLWWFAVPTNPWKHKIQSTISRDRLKFVCVCEEDISGLQKFVSWKATKALCCAAIHHKLSSVVLLRACIPQSLHTARKKKTYNKLNPTNVSEHAMESFFL